MATTYTTCDSDVSEKIRALIHRFHRELDEAQVTFNLLFAAGEDGESAIKAPGGWPAAAKVKINNLRDRVAGLADVTILIDGDTWEKRSAKEQAALLDHELEHLEVRRDDAGAIKRDDAGRPKLRTRMHDWEAGVFESVIDRHGEAALEAQSIRKLCEREVVQKLFSFMTKACETP